MSQGSSPSPSPSQGAPTRVLMLTPTPPYPTHQGNALRNFGLLRALAGVGSQITLLTFQHDAAELEPLRALCKDVITIPAPTRTRFTRLRDLAQSPLPDLARRLESSAFRGELARLLRHEVFDWVQAEGLEMAIYLEQVRAAQPYAVLCYDAHNAEFALQANIAQAETRIWRFPSRLYSHIQTRRIARFERHICGFADGVIAVSDDDAAALRPFRPTRPVAVLPNGISTQEYARPERGASLDLGQHALVFTGKMDYRPNVDAVLWFTRHIWPRIGEQVPDARLYIVGQRPHAALNALRTLPNVAITGWIPQVQPYLHAASVYIAPLRMGSGTRLKLLEAMAAGCAIVATPTAASGLNTAALNAMQLADGEEAFASAVVALLRDSQARASLGEQAQAVVRADYDWNALAPQFLHIVARIRSDAAGQTDTRLESAPPSPRAVPQNQEQDQDRNKGGVQYAR